LSVHQPRPKIACRRGAAHAWPIVRYARRVAAISKHMRRAVEAVLSVLPTQTQNEASAEAVNAIAYATKYHSDWFWKGAQQIRKWRGTSH
jgi:hypothetical protein